MIKGALADTGDRERRLGERDLPELIVDTFLECVGAHINVAPLCFPEGGKTADLVTVHNVSCNAQKFLIDSSKCTNTSDEGCHKICTAFESLWDSLVRCGLTDILAYMQDRDLHKIYNCVDEGRFDNVQFLWPVLTVKVMVVPESFRQLKEATRLAEIKTCAQTLLLHGKTDLRLTEQKREEVLAEIERQKKKQNSKGPSYTP